MELNLLRMLDSAASGFNFLVLDNANIEFADARLTAFLSDDSWLVFFEDVGWSPAENAFVNGVYGFGAALAAQGFQQELIPLTENPANPISDPETGDCVGAPDDWSVIIGGKVHRFTPSFEEYARVGLSINAETRAICPRDVLRFLVSTSGHIFFASDQDLLASVDRPNTFAKFLQTTDWQHPDIAGKELPSSNISMKSLAFAIKERRAEVFEKGVPNTSWRSWI